LRRTFMFHKKFLTVMAVLLGASLFFIGCSTDSDDSPGTNPDEEDDPEIVSLFALDDFFDQPVAGVAPVTSFTGNDEYVGTTVAWSAGGTALEGNFVGGAAYTAAVTLTAKTGYTFTGITGTFTYTDAEVTTGANGGTTMALSIAFPATKTGAELLAINLGGTGTNVSVSNNTVTVGTGEVTIAGTDAARVREGVILNVTSTLTVEDSGSAVIGTTGNTVTLALVSVTEAAGDGADGSLTLAADSALTFETGGSITAAGTGSIVIGSGGNTITLIEAALEGGAITAGPELTLAATDSPLTVETAGTVAVAGDASIVIGAASDTVTLSNVALTGASLEDGVLNLGSAVAFEAEGSIIAAGTGSVVVGSDVNTVTLTGATLEGGAIAAGSLVLADGETLTLADDGTIVVAGTATLALVHAVFNEGTFTAVGEVVIAAHDSGGDTITTSDQDGEGLILGATATALSLFGQGTSAAVYTLTAVAGGNVRFGNDTDAIKVGHATDLTTGNASTLAASATAKIVLGTTDNATDAIALGHNAVLAFTTGAKIGVFTGTPATLETGTESNGSVGGAEFGTASEGTLANDTGTLTATDANVTLTGADGGASSIAAAATFVAASDGG
jgi:hypothetical protein